MKILLSILLLGLINAQTEANLSLFVAAPVNLGQ